MKTKKEYYRDIDEFHYKLNLLIKEFNVSFEIDKDPCNPEVDEQIIAIDNDNSDYTVIEVFNK